MAAEPGVPSLDELNALDEAGAARALAPLFEAAPRFVARLAAERPYADDEELIARAREIARSMPEDEQIELVNAHPPIGADPGAMSQLSRREQGHEDEADLAADEQARTHEELAMLNEIYERRHGFRYVVFVAGRPKSEIVLLLERAIIAERDAELRRALDDTVNIAADRLARLRTEDVAR